MRIPGACGGKRTLPRIRWAPFAFAGEGCEGGVLSGARITHATDCRPTEEWSRPDLSRAAHTILEAGELLDADRAACVEATGGDTDLGAETELAAVGELGRGVV